MCDANATAAPALSIGRSSYGRFEDEEATGMEEEAREAKNGVCDAELELGIVSPNVTSAPEPCSVTTPSNKNEEFGDAAASDSSSISGVGRLLIFAAFGAGSGWVVVNAAFLQLPIYQRQFGLAASNRMTIGYNLGTLVVPLFALARAGLRAFGRGIHYKSMIVVIAIVNCSVLLRAACGIETVEDLVLLNFVGGACGYLTGFVHQAYLLSRYESTYVVAFWIGDTGCACLAALLAIAQRPDETDGSGPRFSSGVFYAALAPAVPLSLVSLFVIERYRIGVLPSSTVERALQGAEEGGGTSFDHDSIEQNARLTQTKDGGTSCAAEMDMASAAILLPKHPARILLRKVWAAMNSQLAGIKTRPLDSMLLLGIVFWTQFANWGIGDSVYPYACASASPGAGESSETDACVFRASLCTVFAELLGTHIAVLVRDPAISSMQVPLVMYTVVFVLLCLAAGIGGRFAQPLGANYIVVLVALMRILGPFMRQLVTRMIQILYEPLVWDDVNFVLLLLGTFSNLFGVGVGTAFIDE